MQAYKVPRALEIRCPRCTVASSHRERCERKSAPRDRGRGRETGRIKLAKIRNLQTASDQIIYDGSYTSFFHPHCGLFFLPWQAGGRSGRKGDPARYKASLVVWIEFVGPPLVI